MLFYPKSETKFRRLPQIVLSYIGNEEYDSVIDVKLGVPIKVMTNINTFKDLHLVENNHKQVVLRWRNLELKRMKELYLNAFEYDKNVSELNTLKTYMTDSSSEKDTIYTYMRAVYYSSLTKARVRTTGKNMFKILQGYGSLNSNPHNKLNNEVYTLTRF